MLQVTLTITNSIDIVNIRIDIIIVLYTARSNLVERTDDEQFNDEKAYLIKQIHEMKSAASQKLQRDFRIRGNENTLALLFAN